MKTPHRFVAASILLTAVVSPVFAQTPTPTVTGGCHGTITIRTQADVDGLAGCEVIEGDLIISYSSEDLDLSPLSSVRSISGDFILRSNRALTSLDGLQGLTSVGRNLNIESNWFLVSLDGLQGLNSVGGYLVIDDNESLASLHGLQELTSLGGSLEIGTQSNQCTPGPFEWYCQYVYEGNDALLDISALDNLTYIGGNLTIAGNRSLESLNGLDGLSVVGGNLEIGSHIDRYWYGRHWYDCYGNNALCDISALQNLSYLGGVSRIVCNQSLDWVLLQYDVTSVITRWNSIAVDAIPKLVPSVLG